MMQIFFNLLKINSKEHLLREMERSGQKRVRILAGSSIDRGICSTVSLPSDDRLILLCAVLVRKDRNPAIFYARLER
jgi:hypothetical protein